MMPLACMIDLIYVVVGNWVVFCRCIFLHYFTNFIFKEIVEVICKDFVIMTFGKGEGSFLNNNLFARLNRDFASLLQLLIDSR